MLIFVLQPKYALGAQHANIIERILVRQVA
jgi:hypothetical protein